MESSVVDNKRITKNAAVLYLRMAVTMFVSFYTSRIILQVLGVEDFGIYNVVYGVTMIVTFFSGSLMNVTQRYLNLGIGANDLRQTNRYFNQFLVIFLTISLCEPEGPINRGSFELKLSNLFFFDFVMCLLYFIG